MIDSVATVQEQIVICFDERSNERWSEVWADTINIIAELDITTQDVKRNMVIKSVRARCKRESI